LSLQPSTHTVTEDFGWIERSWPTSSSVLRRSNFGSPRFVPQLVICMAAPTAPHQVTPIILHPEGISGRKRVTRLAGRSGAKLPTVNLSRRDATLPQRVLGVLLGTTQEEVLRSAAPRYIAVVEHVETWRNRTVGQLPREAMRLHLLLKTFGVAIARATTPRPQPTLTRGV